MIGNDSVTHLYKLIISTVTDGTMKRTEAVDTDVDRNRRTFLQPYDQSPERSVLVQLDYQSDDFCRYSLVDDTEAGEGMVREGRIADGLATQCADLALFLPLADCNGAVLYDPEHHALMVTHLGRHNLVQHGGQRSVEFMRAQFDTDPTQLIAQFSPCAGQRNYPLHNFDGRSIADVSREQLLAAGVKPDNITDPAIDTTTDQNYFSHSEFLRGNRPTDGRFAVAAWLRSR